MIQLTLLGQVPRPAQDAYHAWLEDAVLSKLCRQSTHELTTLWNFGERTGQFEKLTPQQINKLRERLQKYIAQGGS